MKQPMIIGVALVAIVLLAGLFVMGAFNRTESGVNVNPRIGEVSPTTIITPSDSVTFQGTVVSVIAGDSIFEDRVIVRIDAIQNYGRDEDASYARVSDSIVGQEVDFGLAYSARKALVHCEELETRQPGTDDGADGEVMVPQAPAENSQEDTAGTSPIPEGTEERYVFTYYTRSCPADLALDGLTKNDSVQFTVAYNGDFSKIGIYYFLGSEA